MKSMKTTMTLILLLMSFAANAQTSETLFKRIVAQGVPPKALAQLLKFKDEFKGREFNQDTYECEGLNSPSVQPCEEKKRRRSSKTVSLGNPTYVAIVDYGALSSTRRFFLINLKTGEVNKYFASHGLGSGKSDLPTKFSNIKDSKQTSLGMYLTGETYQGHYGRTLRMYGLERSNDEGYNRDIVLHGAWYASEDFINSTNSETGKKFGRLGVSWGCPAVALSIAKTLIPLLQGGSLILHYHPTLMDEAQSGKEVSVNSK